jgi:dCTP deaminase
MDPPHGRAARHDRAVRAGQVKHNGGERLISYGTSSYGYDVRCANEFKIFTNINSTIVDPKNFDSKNFVDMTSDVCIIPPNSFALARTVEFFRIPRNVLTICLGKSTYARCGIIVNVTPLEPEWEGHVTLEFSNTTPLPARIYAHEGVAQMLFFESDEVCETSYKDRGGKYMGQKGVTLPGPEARAAARHREGPTRSVAPRRKWRPDRRMLSLLPCHRARTVSRKQPYRL